MLVIMTTVSFYLYRLHAGLRGTCCMTAGRQPDRDDLRGHIELHLASIMRSIVRSDWSSADPRRLFGFGIFLTAYPALAWLAASPTFPKMLMVYFWLSFIYASYNGAMIVALTEVMPVGVRTSVSLAYSLATLRRVHGGICTWLIATTGDNASPGYWMSAAAICGLAGTFFVYRMQERPALSGASSGERVIGA